MNVLRKLFLFLFVPFRNTLSLVGKVQRRELFNRLEPKTRNKKRKKIIKTWTIDLSFSRNIEAPSFLCPCLAKEITSSNYIQN